jgi:hypothetical protein
LISSSLKRPHRCWGQCSLFMLNTAVLSGGLGGRSVIMTVHLRLSQRVRHSGAIPVLPLYTFMPWMEKALSFDLIFKNSDHTVLNGLMTGKNRLQPNLALSWHLPEGQELRKTIKYVRLARRCPGQDSKEVPPELKPTASPFKQPTFHVHIHTPVCTSV